MLICYSQHMPCLRPGAAHDLVGRWVGRLRLKRSWRRLGFRDYLAYRNFPPVWGGEERQVRIFGSWDEPRASPARTGVFVNANGLGGGRSILDLNNCAFCPRRYTRKHTACIRRHTLPSAPLSANRRGRVAEGFPASQHE